MELCACASRRESVRVKAGLPSAACPTITAQKELQCTGERLEKGGTMADGLTYTNKVARGTKREGERDGH